MPWFCIACVKNDPAAHCQPYVTSLYALQQLLHRTKEMDMAHAIESFIDRLMGPFARELARMPASSFRYLIGGF